MKHILILILLVISIYTNATNYFVKASGNDLNTGLSDAQAWQTLSKVNSKALVNGDIVSFNKGDTFFGTLIAYKASVSGTPVIYNAYGTGNKPVITSMQTITGWTLHSGKIYKSTANIPTNCNIVTFDGNNQEIGRYPSTGYNTFESFSGLTSITDNQLTNSPNFTGAEVVIYKSNWTVDRSVVTNHTNTTVTYTSGSSWAMQSSGEYKYFFQKSINCLLKNGDWYTDGTTFYMYFDDNNPSTHVVKASNSNYTIQLDRKHYNTFRDLKIEGGNLYGVNVISCVGLTLKKCDIINTGQYGLYAITNATTGASTNTLIDSCTVTYVNGTGVSINSAASKISNSLFNYCGYYEGMGAPGGGSHYGVYSKGIGNIIEYAEVANTGYVPIYWESDNTEVRYSIIHDYPRMSIMRDGGGIYTFSSVTNSGQKVHHNLVYNALSNGLYSDGASNHVEFYNNVVYNIDKWGIHMNEPIGNIVHDNIFYDCTRAAIDVTNQYYNNVVAAGNNIYNNIVVQGASTDVIVSLQDQNTNNQILNLGTMNNNRYIVSTSATNVFFNQKGSVTSLPFSIVYRNFETWKTFTGKEATTTLETTDLSQLVFAYNNSFSNQTVVITTPKKDQNDVVYTTNTTIVPFTALILFPTTVVVPPDPVEPTGDRVPQKGPSDKIQLVGGKVQTN